ncbi:hypothetical protein SARC_03914 [Sphaeroforma arctica JP610]|uniref:Cullin family profile domain-containing protein n=1 Tax=Sphaeroforma arctica JP610 TaxID=667725 RepID=A0A0L0G419_9EUKA|nr:hypothetical protein SARC_03914 [Sphaeroforma arctica JP610]KNC83857.1 hypothetical protein SARC_03914 [Sphaeroforma arctica JP610]|eukprot:XP_014157759.1 hypothetical protein SARC_03914 [Sphaeroforma arctica JP610]
MHQAFVLLLLNKNDKLTIGQVQQHTGLGTVELERVLLSLACGKKNTRVLLKTPKSDSVAATDVFTVNEKFDNKLRRVKILQIQLKETIDEQRATQEQVFQDRQHQVDACIVRIMKTRKTMGHQLLIGAILEILKLPIKPTDLKKRIESLIDREYLERDENDSTKYHYMA